MYNFPNFSPQNDFVPNGCTWKKHITNHEKKEFLSKNSSKLVTFNFGSMWYSSSSMTQLKKLPALMYFSKKTLASTLNLYYFLHDLIHERWLLLIKKSSITNYMIKMIIEKKFKPYLWTINHRIMYVYKNTVVISSV